jgi:hypothetical protein
MATVAELRKWYDEMVDALRMEGVCITRECMCDTSAPIVKLGAVIGEMERDEHKDTHTQAG